MKIILRRALYFLSGAFLCGATLLFRIYTLQAEAAGAPVPPRFLQSLIGALPWIAVAVVILLWRNRGRRVHPVAFLIGIATPLVLTYIWLQALQ